MTKSNEGKNLHTEVCKANPETQHALNTDPRVVDYRYYDSDGDYFEFRYARNMMVGRIYIVNARQLGIPGLATEANSPTPIGQE